MRPSKATVDGVEGVFIPKEFYTDALYELAKATSLIRKLSFEQESESLEDLMENLSIPIKKDPSSAKSST